MKIIKISLALLVHTLKGQSNEIFDLQFFFHHLNHPGPLTNRLKYFRFWLGFRQIIQISSGYDTAQSQFPQGIIPR